MTNAYVETVSACSECRRECWGQAAQTHTFSCGKRPNPLSTMQENSHRGPLCRWWGSGGVVVVAGVGPPLTSVWRNFLSKVLYPFKDILPYMQACEATGSSASAAESFLEDSDYESEFSDLDSDELEDWVWFLVQSDLDILYSHKRCSVKKVRDRCCGLCFF